MMPLMPRLQGEKSPKLHSNNGQAVNQKLTFGGGGERFGKGVRRKNGGLCRWGGVQARWVMGEIKGREALDMQEGEGGVRMQDQGVAVKQGGGGTAAYQQWSDCKGGIWGPLHWAGCQ